MKMNVKMLDCECTFPVAFQNAQPMTVIDNDYDLLENKPSINNVTLQGNLTSDDLGIAASFPEQGLIGDILTKTSGAKDGVSWVTPASRAEQDNTRPITAAGVYTEIGNINALLATI